MPEILLRPSEVGQRLGFRRTKMYELLASGVLPVIRHNARVVRIRESDLDRWIAAGCPTAEPSSQKAS